MTILLICTGFAVLLVIGVIRVDEGGSIIADAKRFAAWLTAASQTVGAMTKRAPAGLLAVATTIYRNRAELAIDACAWVCFCLVQIAACLRTTTSMILGLLRHVRERTRSWVEAGIRLPRPLFMPRSSL